MARQIVEASATGATELLTGNLAPADLPNPHEPIRRETTFDMRVNNGFSPVPQSPHSPLTHSDSTATVQAHHMPSPTPRPSDGAHGLNGRGSEGQQQELLRPESSTATRNNWLTRLLHNSSENNSRDK
ncbi:MAG: hypothetical protein NVS3B14_16880 [Ktedonobacteraceae bacterium]